MKKIVIIPAYNERNNIINVINDLKENAPDFDYVIINDGSTDDTMSLCVENGLNVVNLPVNLGIGACVQTGYIYALDNGYDIAVQFDGDGQHKAKYLKKMYNEMIKTGSDMVIGSRYLIKDGFQSTALRRIGITILSKLIKALHKQEIKDVTSGFRMINKKLMTAFSEYYPYDYPEPETIAFCMRKKFKIVEVPVTIALITIVWMKINKMTFLNTLKLRASHVITLAVVCLLVSFFYFGKTFLYEETGYWMVIDKIQYFLLLYVFVLIYIIFSMKIFDDIKHDIIIKADNIKEMKYKYNYITLFIIQTAIFGVYYYALNPGNMSYDTYNQVSQLKGLVSYNTWHPIGHTLFLGLLLKIWDNYAIITIFQILFFAGVTSKFYLILLKHNVKWQIIYLTAIIMASIPSVGINIVTQWKDIPYTVGLLWGTLILFRMNLERDYFSKIINAIEFGICMLIISLFRFNGILAFIVLFIYAFMYILKGNSRQKKNYYISAASKYINMAYRVLSFIRIYIDSIFDI